MTLTGVGGGSLLLHKDAPTHRDEHETSTAALCVSEPSTTGGGVGVRVPDGEKPLMFNATAHSQWGLCAHRARKIAVAEKKGVGC